MGRFHMRYPGLPRALGYAAVILVVSLALVGASTRAGERGNEKASAADLLAGRLGAADHPPRFVVLLQLEEAGIQGFFKQVSGLGSENEVVEFRDGSDPNVVHKLPGRLKWPPIVLKRGVTSDTSLWQWRRLVETGNVNDARTSGKLILFDRGNAIATWRFVNGWPAKISGPELSGEGTDIAIEELVIAHDGMLRES
jgi:phage tail-like protein